VDDGSATEAGVPSESAAGVALASGARPLKSAQPEGLGGWIGAEMSAIDKFTRRHVEMARRDAEKVQAIERTRAAVQEFYAKPDGAAAAPARAAAAPPPPPMATAEGDAPTVAPAA
jgi:hypothetical protein